MPPTHSLRVTFNRTRDWCVEEEPGSGPPSTLPGDDIRFSNLPMFLEKTKTEILSLHILSSQTLSLKPCVLVTVPKSQTGRPNRAATARERWPKPRCERAVLLQRQTGISRIKRHFAVSVPPKP